MHTTELLLRCYTENKDHQWHAFCIDLNLAAQGDTVGEVREKLSSMIREYVYDATVGEHKEYADQLLNRKAPVSFRIKYLFYTYKRLLLIGRNDVLLSFKEVMPLVPAPTINNVHSKLQAAHV
uniref:DUF1902 domain-containing protein n=1 Tax=Candidatus Kentrum sp. TUN TaxID=2126343 RepID=A0A451ACT2_9GAMM|nr:MAG: hypothetical protein BECKTUN1418F_GA0071002_10964 [Candidatus Kentron sp. TUN]VFK60763.1 MAG: hypothetical protein BECKTUN1418D_GA0071000_11345 [Candidatus Kentron sp. TUN]VFK63860.1 MAG: hypothetical protein BECKTUN1418E_GA0071001_10933 [Candidatus Kentron sp. TUN]